MGMNGATDRFDVFISFAEDDREWAEGFLLAALTTSGIRCCTVDDFPAGMPLLEASSQAVELSDRILVVLSPAYVSDHAQQFVTLLGQHFGAEQARRGRSFPYCYDPPRAAITP